jgi:Polyketide cyclase / dehydrase and lipid transport
MEENNPNPCHCRIRTKPMILQLVSLGTLGLLGMGWCIAGRAEPPVPADAAPRAIVAVQASVLIRRPLHEVFAFVANAENDPAWRSEVKSLRNLGTQAAGLGTRSLEVASVFGKELQTVTEVTEFVADQRSVRRTLSGAAPVNTERSVVAVENGTVFTYTLKADVTDVFVFRALRPLIEWWYARKLRRYVQVLKDVLEGPGATP